jgi:hypothetical protein
MITGVNIRCRNCNKVLGDNFHTVEGKLYCEDCYEGVNLISEKKTLDEIESLLDALADYIWPDLPLEYKKRIQWIKQRLDKFKKTDDHRLIPEEKIIYQRFGQMIYNAIRTSTNAKNHGILDEKVFVADMLWNIENDALEKEIKQYIIKVG